MAKKSGRKKSPPSPGDCHPVDNNDQLRQFERKISQMRILTDIGNALNSTLELDLLFKMIVASVTRELRGEIGSLMLVEDGELIVKAAQGIPEKLVKGLRISLGESVAGWVAEHAQPLLIEDITREKRFKLVINRRSHRRKYKTDSCLCIPILHKGEVLGVFNCTDRIHGGPFGEEDLEFVKILASQAAVAIVNARMMNRIRTLADHDGLTGLFNHRYFIERLAAEAERVDRYKSETISLAMIDIDRFKQVNDTLGHEAGDEVLMRLADKLRRMTRRVDVVCRYGGEEFAIILPEIDCPEAVACMERVLKAVERMRVKIAQEEVSITISAGLTGYPTGCRDSKKLISYADSALYQAKKDGRNCIRIKGDPK
ncbi:MAG: sensor domain-containing diguanylate cyclase [Gemmatimonadota bacterium]|nr:sensor domain-containing diguanylate cyclase [Gemmatimonadota bacterium]